MSEKTQQAPEKELKRRFQLWLRPSVLDNGITREMHTDRESSVIMNHQ